jgi:FtsH-binding integral membrane protein
MWVNAAYIVSGFVMNLISIIAMVYLMVQIHNRANSEDSRMMYLAGLAFMMGFLVGPSMHYLVDVEPMIVMQALMYTGVAFTSFSLISLKSKRRSYLFIGGIIMTMLQCMFLYRMIGWLTGYTHGGHGLVYLMFGLLMACLYIIYDTQIIVERAERGDKDVPSHTMMLFVDLFQLFIKILQILIKLNEDKKDKNDRRRR